MVYLYMDVKKNGFGESSNSQRESRRVVAEGWVSIWDEKVLETDDAENCTTVWKYVMPLKCTLKNR